MGIIFSLNKSDRGRINVSGPSIHFRGTRPAVNIIQQELTRQMTNSNFLLTIADSQITD